MEDRKARTKLSPKMIATVAVLLGSATVSGAYNAHKHPSDRLKDLLTKAREEQQAVRIVGVHDALSARIVQQQYELQVLQHAQTDGETPPPPLGLFVSGFGVSAARLGRPDVSILTRYEIEDTSRNIIRAVCTAGLTPPPPVIMDGDTGFGGTANMQETIRRTAAIKAAAITIEDQVFPKKCTYLAGSGINIVSRNDAINRVRTALAAKQEAEEVDGNKLSVVARTDCRMAFGLDEAIERCLAFQELGADMVYAENLQSPDEYITLRETMFGSKSSNNAKGVPPMIIAQFQTGDPNQKLYSVDEIASMGYEMALYGVAGLQATVSVLQSVASELLNDTTSGRVVSTPLSTLEDIKGVVGFSDLDAFEQKYGCT